MITIYLRANGFVVKGHASYAEEGSDIVCAGVSTLVQACYGELVNIGARMIIAIIRKGYADVHIGGTIVGERAEVVLGVFRTGALIIANEYPNYVEVVEHE